MGIKRSDGRVATRNYIGILSSVNCSATAARAIADHFSRQNQPGGAGRFPERRRRGRPHPRHRLRHGHRGRRACRSWSARWPATPPTPTSGACWWSGLGCEANQINAWLAHSSLREGETLKVFNIQDTGGTRKTVRKGHRADRGNAAAGQRRAARALQRRAHHDRPAVRRLRRLLGHQRQSGAGRGGGPAGGAWRHGHPVGDARDLRRRAPADAAGDAARSRREADRAHPLVGALHQGQRGRDEQQSLARQQGRRPHHHPGEVAGRGGQGRHHQSAGGLRIRRAGDASTASSTWTPPATTR